jgi:hypothetical protein
MLNPFLILPLRGEEEDPSLMVRFLMILSRLSIDLNTHESRQTGIIIFRIKPCSMKNVVQTLKTDFSWVKCGDTDL